MLKRVLALCTACLLLLGAAACGKDPAENTSSDTSSASQPSGGDASAPEDTGTQTGDATATMGSDASGESQTTGSGSTKTTSGKGDNTTANKTTTTTAKPKEGGNVVWWTGDPGVKAAKHLDKALADFTAKTGYKVKLSIQTESGGTLTPFDAKFVPAYAAGNGPDVCGFNYINPDYAIDITDQLGKDFWAQFFPSVQEKLKLNNKYYSTPGNMSVNGLLCYSKVDLKNAGLDPNSPPTTIDQMDKMMDKLFISDGADGYKQVGFQPWNFLFLKYPTLLFKPFGGDMYNGEGYPTANSAENVKAVEWMMSYAKKYGKDKIDNSLSKLTNENNSFSHGVAMTASFSAGLNAMAQGKVKTDEWGITVFPGVDKNHNGLSLGLSSGYSVLKKCKNIPGAVAFVKYMGTDYPMEYMVKNYMDFGTYSTNQSAWKKYLNSMDAFTKMMYNDVITKASVKDMGSRLTLEKYTAPATYDTMLQASLKKILNGEAEIRAELDALQKRVAAQTKKNF